MTTEKLAEALREAMRVLSDLPSVTQEGRVRAAWFVARDALREHDAAHAQPVRELTAVTVLPDGSAFATASWPLPKTHWLYAEGHNVPPMPLRMGTDNPERQAMNQKVWAAAKYAVRAATMNGKEPDFDPDALCQNMVVGLLGYHTADGLSSDAWENPPPAAQGA